MARTIYTVVNTAGAIGAVDWHDDVDSLPTFGPDDKHFVITVPAPVADDTDAITSALDGLLGDYDLPDGWEIGPIGQPDANLVAADLLDKAADMLDREEVFYSMGLDYDHVPNTYFDVEVTKTDLHGKEYTVKENVPMTDDQMEAEIKEQEQFILSLRATAATLRDQA